MKHTVQENYYYGDRIIITSGFFKGSEGRIIDKVDNLTYKAYIINPDIQENRIANFNIYEINSNC